MVKKLPFKYLIKLHIYPFLATVESRFGISWSTLGEKKYSVFTVFAQAKKLLDKIKFGSSNNPKFSPLTPTSSPLAPGSTVGSAVVPPAFNTS